MLDAQPRRPTALNALATIRERQNRPREALDLLARALAIREDTHAYERCGRLQMALGNTAAAIEAFENGLALAEAAFASYLDLGACYLAAARHADAARVLEMVRSDDPTYPMALFKRAQVAVLMQDPEAARWIELARDNADAVTQPLIASEKLFELVIP